MIDDSSRPPTAARFEAATDLDVVVRRFERRAESIATILARRLTAAASLHDLSRRRLKNSHRDVARLANRGSVPSAAEFWRQTAEPRAKNLLDAVRLCMDAESDELTKALQQLAVGVRTEVRATGGSLPPGWTANDIRVVADRGIQSVTATITTLPDINEVGRWWQAQLRRRAALTVWPRIIVSPLDRVDLLVARAEMSLLERPPWSHDDRLLTAFELAHSDARHHAVAIEDQLRRRATSMLDAAINQELSDGPATVHLFPPVPTPVRQSDAIELA